MKLLRILSTVVLTVLIMLQLSGCTPTRFIIGDEISTPQGCVEARKRGPHEC